MFYIYFESNLIYFDSMCLIQLPPRSVWWCSAWSPAAPGSLHTKWGKFRFFSYIEFVVEINHILRW